ncbi:transporter substrate-binding domain-containing protein [Streptomyces benahoarensis]|nr:transporter substrate-binding domain-containing protein [Streptomyces benahoarensis]
MSVLGAGALAWTLWPHANDSGRDPSVGATPPARKPSPGGSKPVALPADIRARGSLTVGSDLRYAPMEFLQGGRPAGLDIALAQALGRDLGVGVKIVNGALDALLPGLASGRYDLVLSALTDTAERQRDVDLIDYFRSGFALVVRRADRMTIKGLDDLTGRVVAVQQGTAARDHLAGLGPQKPKIRAFATADEVYADVTKGGSDACLDDYPVAVRTVADHATLAVTGRQIAPRPCGIAVAKSKPALRDAVRASLDRLIMEGSYEKILGTWGVTAGAVTRAKINGGS